jgi:hypothetical protein
MVIFFCCCLNLYHMGLCRGCDRQERGVADSSNYNVIRKYSERNSLECLGI